MAYKTLFALEKIWFHEMNLAAKAKQYSSIRELKHFALLCRSDICL